MIAQERGERHQDAWRAETALQSVRVAEGSLKRIQLAGWSGEALNGLDLVAIGLDRQHDAGPRRFTVEEYERLGETGVLCEDDSVELLEGLIVKKTTKNPLHDATIDILTRLFGRLLPSGWFLRVQNVLRTSDSEPEPDVVVTRGEPAAFRRRHPWKQFRAGVYDLARAAGLFARLMWWVEDPALRREYRRRAWGVFLARRDPGLTIYYLLKCAAHYHFRALARGLADGRMVSSFETVPVKSGLAAAR